MGGFELAGRIGELADFEQRFARFVEHRTAIYTMGDSTSVPKHVAVELLQSISFLLGIDPSDPEVPERLLHADLEAEYRKGIADIERKVELAGELWRQVVETMPPIGNISLEDTLRSIGEFPRTYDYRSMAHRITADIDYQLCHPVPDDLEGVDYIIEYLQRLLIEADFLSRFDLPKVLRVLESSCPDYVGLLINLYEPVATNAIWLALLGRDPRELRVTSEERESAAERLRGESPAGRAKALREAALAACAAVGVDDSRGRGYAVALAEDVGVRLCGR